MHAMSVLSAVAAVKMWKCGNTKWFSAKYCNCRFKSIRGKIILLISDILLLWICQKKTKENRKKIFMWTKKVLRFRIFVVSLCLSLFPFGFFGWAVKLEHSYCCAVVTCTNAMKMCGIFDCCWFVAIVKMRFFNFWRIFQLNVFFRFGEK